MKNNQSLLILMLLLEFNLFAQQFHFEQLPSVVNSSGLLTEFELTSESSIDYADIDNDGDLDMLIAGENRYSEYVINMYLNDGIGSYYKNENFAPIPLSNPIVRFADFDSDGDEDLLYAGRSISGVHTKLYMNIGGAEFIENTNENLSLLGVVSTNNYTTGYDVNEGDVVIADFDNDELVDLLICTAFQSVLYANFNGFFFADQSEDLFTPLKEVRMDFTDFENDNAIDLILMGKDYDGAYRSLLYKNDGTANFSLHAELASLKNGECEFVDVNNDDYEDVVIMGVNENENAATAVYLNEQGVYSGYFSGIANMKNGDLEFGDLDGDGDPDLLICSAVDVSTNVFSMYENVNGFFHLKEHIDISSYYHTHGSVVIFDADLDGDNDFVYAGLEAIGAGLFLNDGDFNFDYIDGTTFGGCQYSSSEYADVNGDGYMDFVIAGSTNGFGTSTRLFINDTQGGFYEREDHPFFDSYYADMDFADVDGDGDQDLLMAGRAPLESNAIAYSKLYLNDGQGNFEELEDSPFVGCYRGVVAMEDVDADGDQDVIIYGDDGYSNWSCMLYHNQGDQGWSSGGESPFVCGENGVLKFVDIDHDDDVDLFVSRVGEAGFYMNDGYGDFTYNYAANIDNFLRGEAKFADLDMDGDLDLMTLSPYQAYLYLNDGNTSFTLHDSTTFEPFYDPAMDLKDLDLDGDIDIVQMGRIVGHSNNPPKLIVYLNDGQANFTQTNEVDFIGAIDGSIDVFDMDNDGDYDVLISGLSELGIGIANMYENLHDPNAIYGCLDAEAFNYSPLATHDSEECVYCQIIDIPMGWSIFSTYILSTSNLIVDVLSELVDDIVIVKNNEGMAYIPEWDFDGIGALVIGEAYDVKLSSERNLIVCGTQLMANQHPIYLTEGWNKVAYLRKHAAETVEVLSEITESGNLLIAKDYDGNAYLPEWDFDGIGEMHPGQGYQLKVQTEDVLLYLSNSQSY